MESSRIDGTCIKQVDQLSELEQEYRLRTWVIYTGYKFSIWSCHFTFFLNMEAKRFIKKRLHF